MQTKSIIRVFGTICLGVGFDPRKTISAIRAIPSYLSTAVAFLRQMRASSDVTGFRLVPTLSDRYGSSGTARGHYFHQDLWAAREVFARRPVRHYDVGSRIDGFIAHLLCFRDVEVFDIRSLTSKVSGLEFRQVDMMKAGNLANAEADSVSCLHALEHFGLGRYGDPVDLEGWKKGLANLASMVIRGGALYLSVPVGKPVIEFNAQRIFSAAAVVAEAASVGLEMESFSIVDDQGDFHPCVDITAADPLEFGCGCFLFCKR